MPSGYLGLGSNIGERGANLQAAVDALRADGVAVTASSSVYDTDPVGEILDQASFLNACVKIETDLEPIELLDLVKRIESRLGRELSSDYVKHAPRTIDIDLLMLGDSEFTSERLTLPHLQVATRRFVLIPLLELDFELELPGGVKLSEVLEELPLDEGVRRFGEPLKVG